MHIVLCWELGGGYGHLVPLGLLATHFLAQGWRVSLLCHDAPAAQRLLQIESLNYQSVAHAPAPTQAFPHSWNYADNLWRNGYWHQASLSANLAAWRQQLLALAPDVLLVDHAPSALLASQDFAIPRLAMGMGFTLPPCPPSGPMPALPPWFPLPSAALRAREWRCVTHINHALSTLALAPLQQIGDIFSGVKRLLCAWPELDHYAHRDEPELRWYGPLSDQTQHPAPPWKALNHPQQRRAFVFMDAQHPMLTTVLSALAQRNYHVLAFVRGPSGPVSGPISAPNVHYLTARVCLWQTAQMADCTVLQGGFGSLYPFLLRAVPTFVCPLHLEQAVLAERLRQRGLAAGVSHLSAPTLVAQHLNAWLDEGPKPGLTQASFAARYSSALGQHTAQRLADECVKISLST